MCNVLLIIGALLSLSACSGSGKKIVTTDDSAKYKGSVTLQPLKRPSTVTTSLSTADASPSAANSNAVVRTHSVKDAIVSAITTDDNGMTRLEISADFDQAWAYINRRLVMSELTVFSRNKVAGRFEIGCGDIDSASIMVKKGGWSFLNRDKLENLEYCALEMVERRDKTYLLVLNRSGLEVSSGFSQPILEKILSN